MAEFPAFPLWTDAYLADTGHLSTTEHGAYLLLLITMWRAGGRLPNDDKKLSRYAKCTGAQWDRLKPVLMDFFTVDGGEIIQGRLSDELDFVRRRSNRQSENARAKSRKTKETAKATALPKDSQTTAPTPTPTPTGEKKPAASKKGTRIPDDFKPSLEWSQQQGLTNRELKFEFEQFKDYWTSATGQAASKLDWQAAWRVWIRKRVKGGSRSSPAKSEFRQHQDDVTASLERIANGKPADDDEQPALDLGATDFRRH